MATIREIAKEAGVSVGTVSNVLNDPAVVSPETRERVLEVVRAHNYRPSDIARGLATGRTRTYGLIVSSLFNPFTGGLVQGATEAARDLGCSLLVASATYDGRDVPEQVDALVRKWVDGIFLASQPLPLEIYGQLRFGSTPVVIMDHHGDGSLRNVVGLVGFDWRSAGYQATKHLIDIGHRRIGYVGGIPQRSSTVEREEGYRAALAEAGIQYDPRIHCAGNYLTDSGCHCTKALLSRAEPPTAITLANDMMALGAYQAAAELGMRIPEDVSIVGIDDNFFVAYAAPPLTTVHVPTLELGRLGMRILAEAGRDERKLRHEVLPTELVIRQSSARYPR
jgi:DNA-binding LacI/PurR family transcriptional regulator